MTPRAINSDHCKFEFEGFLGRERELGRADLIFPILYVPVPALASEAQWRNHPVLSVIGKRQYVNWQTFRYADALTPAMREEIARFCNEIRGCLAPDMAGAGRAKAAGGGASAGGAPPAGGDAKRRAEEEAEAQRWHEEEETKRRNQEGLMPFRRLQRRWPLVTGSAAGLAALVAIGAWLASAPPRCTCAK